MDYIQYTLRCMQPTTSLHGNSYTNNIGAIVSSTGLQRSSRRQSKASPRHIIPNHNAYLLIGV